MSNRKILNTAALSAAIVTAIHYGAHYFGASVLQVTGIVFLSVFAIAYWGMKNG